MKATRNFNKEAEQVITYFGGLKSLKMEKFQVIDICRDFLSPKEVIHYLENQEREIWIKAQKADPTYYVRQQEIETVKRQELAKKRVEQKKKEEESKKNSVTKCVKKEKVAPKFKPISTVTWDEFSSQMKKEIPKKAERIVSQNSPAKSEAIKETPKKVTVTVSNEAPVKAPMKSMKSSKFVWKPGDDSVEETPAPKEPAIVEEPKSTNDVKDNHIDEPIISPPKKAVLQIVETCQYEQHYQEPPKEEITTNQLYQPQFIQPAPYYYPQQYPYPYYPPYQGVVHNYPGVYHQGMYMDQVSINESKPIHRTISHAVRNEDITTINY